MRGVNNEVNVFKAFAVKAIIGLLNCVLMLIYHIVLI